MYEDWLSQLVERFPDWMDRDPGPGWAALVQRIKIGDVVSGIVVCQAPFGAWLDIGVGYPALIEINMIHGLTRDKYWNGDWCPVGSRQNGMVCGTIDLLRQIRLSQKYAGFADVVE